MENPQKFGAKHIPYMVANEDDFDQYSQFHVGDKRGFDYRTIHSRARLENSLGELTRKFL